MIDDLFNYVEFRLAICGYQQSWDRWMRLTYPPALVEDKQEANRRFAEEAIEAMQAFGMSKEEVIFQVNHTFSRAKGEPGQEAAGVFATLATMCNAHKVDLGEAAEADMDYCWSNIVEIREKQKTKPVYNPNDKKIAEWTPSNTQVAKVMFLHGNEQQRNEAIDFFWSHLIRPNKQSEEMPKEERIKTIKGLIGVEL